MSDLKNYKPIPRTQSEMNALHMRLMNFLLNCGDYNYVDTQDGILISISPIKFEEASALELPKQPGLITK